MKPFLFYSQVKMSLHESILMVMAAFIMVSILWKWKSPLLILINLELLSAIILSLLYMAGGTLSSVILFILVFFVSEALIILSSLLSSTSFSGLSYSSLIFW